ncbi:MAG: HD domain-containing protein [Deltaproteobacteria bacterium]|nr:HD domain-containing protein [Deltaproteobacteria bacterium]MBW1959983.1 HD domain-containing protein [Deltaproteobacteria bacterium]MBW2153523.1 HD domain-containing protein [Deltaproteobacteria bacterium]
MLSQTEKLNSIANLGVELSQIRDLDILMEKILSEARRFMNADAGSIYIRKDDHLNFISYTQNDTIRHRHSEVEKLIYSTFTLPIDEKSIAGYVAAAARSLNLPDVHRIDPTKPYRFSPYFDEVSDYRTTSVLTIPLVTAKKDVLGVLQVINAQDEEKHVIPFSKNDEKMMLHFASIAAVALERAKVTRAILLRMIRMAEMRDPEETGAHVNRVAGYSVEIYEQWAYRNALPEKKIDATRDILRMAAMLHDVGKVAISDVILKKPSPLTDEEYKIMKQHAVLGARLFWSRQSDLDDAAAEVALNHHERWDGKGYPGYVDVTTGNPLPGYENRDGPTPGKRGLEIPVFGRIVALADVFDALSSARVYKEAWDETRVIETIYKDSGHRFDPELVDILISNIHMIRSIQSRYADSS